MELQPIKQSRGSKQSRRATISSQIKLSGMMENKVNTDNKKSNNNQNYSQIQPVFDFSTGVLNSLYWDTILSSQAKAMMHIGICMSTQNIFSFLKMLFHQSGKSVHGLNKINQRKIQSSSILFVPFWLYRIQNCCIVYWFFQDLQLKQLLRKKQRMRQIQVFLSFPQIIITEKQLFPLMKFKRANLAKKLNFQQQIILLGNNQEVRYSQSREESQKYKIQYVESIDISFMTNLIMLTMKKNSIRCFQQTYNINLYLLESFNQINKLLNKQQFDLSYQQNYTSFVQSTASKYLAQQIYRQYEMLIQLIKTKTQHEKQLQQILGQYQQTFLREVRKNIHILNLKQQSTTHYQSVEKFISANNQQILANNREQIKKQNYQMISNLYQKLLSQFEKGRYNSKDRQNLMAQDLQNMMRQYEKSALKSGSLFWSFNCFMRNNKSKYYQKLKSIQQQQIDHNKKNQNYDDIVDKIEIKQKVLLTLQREVKNLQNKKMKIQSQNQHLKALEKQLNEKINFETEGDQLAQVDSMKTIKNRHTQSISPRKNSSNVAFKTKPNKNKDIGQKNQKQRKCIQCCRCSIF